MAEGGERDPPVPPGAGGAVVAPGHRAGGEPGGERCPRAEGVQGVGEGPPAKVGAGEGVGEGGQQVLVGEVGLEPEPEHLQGKGDVGETVTEPGTVPPHYPEFPGHIPTPPPRFLCPGTRCHPSFVPAVPAGKGTPPCTRRTCAGGGGVAGGRGLSGNHGGCGGFYDNGDNFDGDVSVGPTQDLHQPLLLELRQPPLQRQPIALLGLRGRRAGRPRGAQLLLDR